METEVRTAVNPEAAISQLTFDVEPEALTTIASTERKAAYEHVRATAGVNAPSAKQRVGKQKRTTFPS